MEFYFKTIGAEVYLYLEKGIFDEDLGKLFPTSSGKIVTKKIFGENFELEDISGSFQKGEKYSIKSSKGWSGVIVRKSNNRYQLVDETSHR